MSRMQREVSGRGPEPMKATFCGAGRCEGASDEAGRKASRVRHSMRVRSM
jgi:hypothetical protein